MRRRLPANLVTVTFAICAATACPHSARAGGFEISAHAAQATGQGDAYVAQADSAAAAFYNPAGMTQIQGTEATGGIYVPFTGFEYSQAGSDERSNYIAYLPHFYLVSDLASDRWSFGFAANTVFGLAADWGDDSALQSFVTRSDLAVANFGPSLAYRVNDQLSLAAGANIYRGDLELNNRPTLPAIGPSAFRFQGDDVSPGASASAFYKLDERNSVGLVYRSPFTLDFDGKAVIYTESGAAIGPSDAQASVDFPQIIVLGYAYRPTDRLKLEADVQWADWESLDSVNIESADPRLGGLPATALEWNSTFTYRMGIQYTLSSAWMLRAGYIYSPSATPDETFSAAIVDLDSHIFALGLGYRFEDWSCDLAYRYILGENRSVSGNANSPPGEYSDETSTIMLSISRRM